MNESKDASKGDDGMSKPTEMKEISRQDQNRPRAGDRQLHPAWVAFQEYCDALRHGEIESLKIQDGLPVIAEVTKKKVKFA